jgi:hypothetical protein
MIIGQFLCHQLENLDRYMPLFEIFNFFWSRGHRSHNFWSWEAQTNFFMIWNIIRTKFLIDRAPLWSELDIFGLSFQSGAGQSPNLGTKWAKNHLQAKTFQGTWICYLEPSLWKIFMSKLKPVKDIKVLIIHHYLNLSHYYHTNRFELTFRQTVIVQKIHYYKKSAPYCYVNLTFILYIE